MPEYCYSCMTEITETEKQCHKCGCDVTVAVPAHHLLPGTLLNGKFCIGKALGEGGFGITYIGRDVNLDIKVAIKEYYPNGYVNRSNTTSPQVNEGTTEERKDFFNKGRERFLREARILAKFSGEPGIVDVRDFFEENNTAYIVMEYLDGEDLKVFLRKNGTLTAEKTVNLLMPVMNSLKKVHSENLIHRDISPDNIMLVGDKVKLLDFGAARSVSAAENKSLSIMLKQGYAPEEQYRSKGNQGPWTDIYALCATMYKCITGITPDDATQRVFSDEVKTPTALGVPISSDIENAIMRGMSVHQKDRYQSIEDLIRGLQGIEVQYADSDSTVAAGRKVEEDELATVMGSELVTLSSEEKSSELATPVLEDDKLTVAGTPEIVNKFEETSEPEKNNQPVKQVEAKETQNDVAVVQVVHSEEKPEPEATVKKAVTQENKPQPETVSKKVPLIPTKPVNPSEVIEEKEQKIKKKSQNRKGVLIAILAIIVALVIGVVLFVALKDKPQNKVDPTKDGFVLVSKEDLVLKEPNKELVVSDVYSSIDYNEKMFYGTYSLCPDSKGEELISYQENADYTNEIYTEDDLYLSAIPYKIVAGPQNMASEEIKEIPKEEWMKLYYCSENGQTTIVYAAYEICEEKLIVKPVISYEIGEVFFDYELADEVTYEFEFSGPYLTLNKNGDSVKLVADGFEKNVSGETDKYYNLFVNTKLSESSRKIDDIIQIYISFNESDNKMNLVNSDHIYLDDAVGRLDYNGLFTFSYSDGHEKNTKYFVHQYVYFYCGLDGLILTDGKNTYYYQSDYLAKTTEMDSITTTEVIVVKQQNNSYVNSDYSYDKNTSLEESTTIESSSQEGMDFTEVEATSSESTDFSENMEFDTTSNVGKPNTTTEPEDSADFFIGELG